MFYMIFSEKNGGFASVAKTLSLLASLTLLQACGGEDSGDDSGASDPKDNAAPMVINVVVTDTNGETSIVGDTLMASYVYADIESDAEGESAIRWLRNDVIISSATEMSYTLVDTDADKAIRFEVTPKAATGTLIGIAATSDVINVMSAPIDQAPSVNQAPIVSNVILIDINGDTVIVGDTLDASYTYSDAENDAEGQSAIRWLRNDVVISSATAMNYTLVDADVGNTIKFEITPKAVAGELIGIAATSNVIHVMFAPNANQAPTVSNVSLTDTNGENAVVGDTLMGSYTYADVENDAEGQSGIRWLRNNVAISSATGMSYTLVDADTNEAIRFEVTPKATAGELVGIARVSRIISVMSAPINQAPTISNVTIIDTNGDNAVVGDTLMASYTYADVDNDTEGQSAIRWLRNDVIISSATALSYTLVDADEGKAIRFEVIPKAAAGVLLGIAATSNIITATSAPINEAPTVSNITLTDTNGDNAVVGDTLVASYTYSDSENDAEGISAIRWLRNNDVINGATQ
ncbi:MAG: hypothetical protein COA78_25565, partial [Blastopirellula sp.]